MIVEDFKTDKVAKEFFNIDHLHSLPDAADNNLVVPQDEEEFDDLWVEFKNAEQVSKTE